MLLKIDCWPIAAGSIGGARLEASTIMPFWENGCNSVQVWGGSDTSGVDYIRHQGVFLSTASRTRGA